QPAAVVDRAGEGDHADAAEDQVGLPVRVMTMTLLGGRVPEETARLGDGPAREQDQDADEDGRLEEIAHQPVRRTQPAGREREGVEVARERAAEHGGDLEAEDDEAPEHEEVQPARGALADDANLWANELLLPERIDEHRPDTLGDAIERELTARRTQEVEALPHLVEKQPQTCEQHHGERHGVEHPFAYSTPVARATARARPGAPA